MIIEELVSEVAHVGQRRWLMSVNESDRAKTTSPQRESWSSLFRQWVYPRADADGRFIRLRRLLVHLAVGYAIMVSMLVLLQRKLIYHPSRTDRLLARETSLPHGAVHDIAVTTHDGLTLHGWHFLPEGVRRNSKEECDRHLKQAKWIVLYFHGNAGDRKMREHSCDVFTKNGADVFHFDYRGYAENPGSPNEEDILADAKSIWEYAVNQRNVPAARVVLYGESLGGGVATQLAATLCRKGTPPAALILKSTFSSLVDAGAHHYPWVPVSWFLRDRYESAAAAPDVSCPVLQVHGDEDRIVPPELGRRLFAEFPARSSNGIARSWVDVPHAGHNDLPDSALTSAVRRFFAKMEAGKRGVSAE